MGVAQEREGRDRCSCIRPVSSRARIIGFGSAAVAVLIGALCTILVNGRGATVAGVTLITLGCGAVVLLVFYEVGLSEDHAREREEQRGSSTRRDPEIRNLPWSRRPPRRPGG